MSRPFVKMHGLGNDFLILDARKVPLDLPKPLVQRLADRKLGVGCDQLIVMEPAKKGGDTYMRIWNPDGGEVEACGNATRCLGRIVMEETGKEKVVIETLAGSLIATPAGQGLVTVDMGEPKFDWQDIPLRESMDTRLINYMAVPGAAFGLTGPSAVNVGNPHCVFFVEDVEAQDLEALGPGIENHMLFPERTNVEFAEVRGQDNIRLRVWERGTGITTACGTGACATAVCAIRQSLTNRSVNVELDGGVLTIEWSKETNHIFMTGPASLSFEGTLCDELLTSI
jgi:diaminopimelate epimerase